MTRTLWVYNVFCNVLTRIIKSSFLVKSEKCSIGFSSDSIPLVIQSNAKILNNIPV